MDKIEPIRAINVKTGQCTLSTHASKNDQYKCPECDKEVIYCRGNMLMPYFRHKAYDDNQCTYFNLNNTSESQAHKNAKNEIKEMLFETRKIQYIRRCDTCGHHSTYIIQLSNSANIELEYNIRHNRRHFVADVAVNHNAKPELIVEIFHSHRTKEASRPEPWIEVQDKQCSKNYEIFKNDYESPLTFECRRFYRCQPCSYKKAKLTQLGSYYIRFKLQKMESYPNLHAIMEQDNKSANENGYDVAYGDNTLIDSARLSMSDYYHNLHLISLFQDDFSRINVVLYVKNDTLNCILVNEKSFSEHNYHEYYAQPVRTGNELPHSGVKIEFPKSWGTICIFTFIMCKIAIYHFSIENTVFGDIKPITYDNNKYIMFKLHYNEKEKFKEKYWAKWNQHYNLWTVYFNKFKKEGGFDYPSKDANKIVSSYICKNCLGNLVHNFLPCMDCYLKCYIPFKFEDVPHSDIFDDNFTRPPFRFCVSTPLKPEINFACSNGAFSKKFNTNIKQAHGKRKRNKF